MTAQAPGHGGPDAVGLELDLRGLKCPLPALRTRKALAAAPPGTRLVVRCTDPLAVIDIPHAAYGAGATVEAQETRQGVLTFVLRTGG
ncbi:sulfurtransferase TusA family protein [Xanthobacter sp. AM11]|uniref:sulfurtransferase TusA family protein n=1 Tax=Xanthobacter sp. AM11 TaxID=3380643 RepID=UPI0039BFE382